MLKLALTLGNRCGHQPDAPRLFCEALARAHYFVQLVVKRLAKLVYHQRLTKFFRDDWPELLARECADGQPVRDDYDRRRSERLEAVCLVIGVLLRHLDFGTSRVVLDGGVDRGLTEPQIAEEAGIGLHRVQRALRTLRIAGIISHTEHRRKRVAGCGECRSAITTCKCPKPAPCEFWVSDAAVRKITPRFFAKLGADIVREYKKIRERLNRRPPKLPPPGKPIDLRVPSATARKRMLEGSFPRPEPVKQPAASALEIVQALMAKGMSAAEAMEAARCMRRQE